MSLVPTKRPAPRLLDRVLDRIRLRGLSPSTGEAYVHWIRRYILFHEKRHPAEMGEAHLVSFLTHLVRVENVAPSTQNQARAALVFLYRDVLSIAFPTALDVPRAQRRRTLPIVLSASEVERLLNRMTGDARLVAELLYGSGLRLLEALRLRVSHLDLDGSRLHVVDGKGGKDRVTILSRSLRGKLVAHLDTRRDVHERDLARGAGAVPLPHALARKGGFATDYRWQLPRLRRLPGRFATPNRSSPRPPCTPIASRGGWVATTWTPRSSRGRWDGRRSRRG